MMAQRRGASKRQMSRFCGNISLVWAFVLCYINNAGGNPRFAVGALVPAWGP